MKQVIFNALTTTANRALSTDPESMMYLKAHLKGRRLRLNVEDFDFSGVLIFTEQGVEWCVASVDDSEADAEMTGRLMAILGLSPLAAYAPADAWPRSVQIQGDMRFGEAVRAWLTHLSVDWTAVLSVYLGETLAVGVAGLIKAVSGEVRTGFQRCGLNTRQFLADEPTAVVTQAEVSVFLEAVDDVRHDGLRVEQRVNQWLKQQEASA